MDTGAITIAYIGRTLPSLSETFVVREINALRTLGATVHPISLFQPSATEMHPESEPVFRDITVLYKPFSPSFWLAHLYYKFLHTARYFGLLKRYVFSSSVPRDKRARMFGQFLMAPRAARLIRKRGIQHVHAHFSNSPAGVAMMAAELAGIGFSFTTHSFDLFFENTLLAEKIANARFVATVSEFNVRHLNDTYEEAANADIHIIRCGVDPQRFVPAPHQMARPPMILSVGRLHEIKGFPNLIKAAHILKERGVATNCIIIGKGELQEELESLIEEYDVADCVTLAGGMLQDAVLEHFRKADLFVLPCVKRRYSDNLPVALMESLAMELPTISCPIAAIPELVKNEDTGLLVESDNPRALAEAIERLLDDDELRTALGRRGRDFVAREFDIMLNAEKILKLFHGAVENAKS